MRKATTAHNPDRVIAHSLDGPVYAPDDWSDEQAASFRKRNEATPRATQSCPLASSQGSGELARLLSRALVAAQSRNACCPGSGLQNRRLFPSSAPTGFPFRGTVTSALTSFPRTVSAYRISMVVVAIAMVVLLRALVNRCPQHGGAA